MFAVLQRQCCLEVHWRTAFAVHQVKCTRMITQRPAVWVVKMKCLRGSKWYDVRHYFRWHISEVWRWKFSGSMARSRCHQYLSITFPSSSSEVCRVHLCLYSTFDSPSDRPLLMFPFHWSKRFGPGLNRPMSIRPVVWCIEKWAVYNDLKIRFQVYKQIFRTFESDATKEVTHRFLLKNLFSRRYFRVAGWLQIHVNTTITIRCFS